MKKKLEQRILWKWGAKSFLRWSSFTLFVFALLVSSARAQEVITGRPGVADNRASISFDAITLLDQRFHVTNRVPRENPPPMPLTNTPSGGTGGGGGSDVQAAAFPAPPPGGFNAQPSPPPDMNFRGLEQTGFVIPPDTHGAVGPNHLMVALNDAVRIQDRNGISISTVTLEGFWSVLRVFDVFDPKILYDPYGERWIMTAMAERLTARSSVLIGVSQSSNPRGRWNLYRVDADGDNQSWADYPSIGFNKDWITVTVNMFPIFGFGRTYTGVNIYAFNKQDLYTNGPGRFTLFQENSGRGFTMCPTITQDPLHDTMYLLETDSLIRNYLTTSSILRMSTITGPVGSETLTVGTAFIDPANPWTSSEPFLLFTGSLPQLGSPFGIIGNDSRIQNVVYRNGSLWATHHMMVPAEGPERSAVQWYQLNPSGSIIQYGRLEDTNSIVSYAYPSIAVNRNNDVLIGFSKFASNIYPSAAYAFRSCDDPPGTFRTDFVYKPGETNYFPFGFVGTNFFFTPRWGDYSATVVDPLNDLDMWTIQEYAPALFGTWDTWWAKVAVNTACSQITFAQNEYTVLEGAPPGVASIEVLNLGGFPGSIDFATSDGTAVAGVDYLARSGTLTFAPGQSSTNFTIVILDDPFTNGNRTVNLSLFNPGGGAQLGFLSNAVLVIEDDEAVIPPNVAGEFNYSAYFKELPYSGLFFCTENETCNFACGNDVERRYTPDRTARGVIVTVVRTNGNTGRVLVDFETAVGGTAIPNVDFTPVSGTLLFDHLQTSTNFLVEVASDYFPNGFKFVRLTLSNPRPAPEEEAVRPGFLRPTLGPGSESGIVIIEVNHALNLIDETGTITSNNVVSFERVNYRVDEYPGGPGGAPFGCLFGGVERTGGSFQGYRLIAVSVMASAPVSGTMRVGTSDDTGRLILLNPDYQAGSEQAEHPAGGSTVWSNPVFTDPTLSPIINQLDYFSLRDTNSPALARDDDGAFPNDIQQYQNAGVILTFNNECRKSLIIAVTNDATVEFNEDIVVLLDPRPEDLDIGFNSICYVTIVPDDQPAGALDREWNPAGVGRSDPPFNSVPGTDGFVNTVVVQEDGKTLLGGDFTDVNAKPRNRIARMNPNGTLDLTFNPPGGANDFVSSIIVYSTNDLFNPGKILVAGAFESMNQISRRGIARLNPDGSLDETFRPGNGVNVNGVVRSMALQPDGQILIAGEFFEYDDEPRSGFARLNPDGSLDPTFDIGVGADNNVWAIGFTPDLAGGFKVLVGGDFVTINGEFRPGIAQLNPDGSVDPNFNPGSGVNGPVYSLAVQTNGQVIIAGFFNDLNAVRRDNIARLNTDGSVDESFDPGTGTDDAIYSVVLQPDQKAMIGGIFTIYNRTRRLGIARLQHNGALDTTFMDTAYNQFAGIPNPLSWQPPNFIRGIALQPDGNVMIGGYFQTVGGNPSEDEDLRNYWTVYTRQDKRTRHNIARLIGGITPGPGNAEFAEELYFVNEHGSNAFVRLQRSNGRLGSLYGVATNVTSSAVGTETDPANADFVSTNRANVWSEHRGDAPRPRSAGNTGSIFFRIPILDDLLREGDEQMDLSFLRPDGDVTLGGEFIELGGALGRERARLTISDNDGDPGVLNFITDVYLTNENSGFARITVIRTNGTQGSVTVDYLTQPADTFPATAGQDYRLLPKGTLTFGQGETSKFFTITLIDDTVREFDEYVQLILTNATGGAKLPGGLQTSVALAQLRIVDNDFPPGRVNFAFNSFTNSETDGTATILVSRTGGSMDAVSVQVETVFIGSAADGSDYLHSAATLTWGNGDSGPKPFVVPLLTDGVIEGNESLRIRLFDPRVRGVTDTNLLGGVTNTTLVIRDADFPGSVTFAQPLYQADENASFVAINLLRQGGIAGPGSVTFTAEPDSASAGTDFIPVTTNVTFASGQIGAAVYVQLVDDSEADGNKSVALRLSNPVGVSLGVLPSVTLMIIDNESVNETPGEDDSAFEKTTQTDGPIYSMALQTTNGVVDGRIIIAGDFTAVNQVPRSGLARLMTNGALDASFNVGTGPNAPTRAVAVQPDGKLLVGGFFTQFNNTNRGGIARLHIDGTLDAFFDPGSGADNPVYSIVVQPDEKILVGGAFSRFNGPVSPGIVRLNTNGTLDLSFNVQGGPNGTVYAVALQSDGKILIGGEFTTVNSLPSERLARLNSDGSLDTTFGGFFSCDAAVRTIAVQPDGRIIIGGSFVTVNGVSRPYLARLERDGSVDPTFMNGLPGGNNAVYALALQIDGKVVVGGDFTRFNDVTRNRLTRLNADGTSDTSINFGSGANAFITSLLIQTDRKIVLAGGFTEYDDQERRRITRIHGGSVAGFGGLTFSTDEYRVGENEGERLVTVKRVGGTEGTVSVSFLTLDDTAVAGVDYRATNGVLTFAPGETLLGFSIPVFNNGVTNHDRTVLLLLDGYTGGATSGPQPVATLVIANDESAVGFTQPAYNANENSVSGNATLTLRRTYAISNFLTVNFATVPGGSATPNVDYVPTNLFVTFVPGEVLRNVNVRLINDTNIEGNETVHVVISNPIATTGSGVFLDRTNAVLTIVEDDFAPGQLTLEQSDYTVREDGGSVNLTIVRTNGSRGVVSVRYRTLDNSAIGGFDFVPTNSVLAFADGETRKTVSILISDDTLMEGTENFSVVLSDPQGGATLGARTAANVTIQDNDTNLIVAAGAVLVAESGPVNNFIDPGETVTVAFGLRNIGTSATSNLVATLQNTPNLSASPPVSQSYGVLAANGSSVFRNYTFTANGAIGFRLVATLALNDGLQDFGQVSYAFTLGGHSTNSFCNTNRITINDNAAAAPYPSSLTVSNVGGVVQKVIVTLNRFTHFFPDDVDVLLEGPDGQTVMLMSDVGGGGDAFGLTLSFDDKVAGILPDSAQLISGTFRPGNYATTPTAADSFPLPAPQPIPGGFSPYTNTALSVFAGINPNGSWRLYVVDDTGSDAGVISNGWCLTLVSGDPVSSGIDLALTGQDSPDPVVVGSLLTYRWGITNVGFATASGAVFSTTVDPKTTFISASAGSGTPSLVGSNLTHNIGTLAPGAGTFVQMVVQPNFGGFIKTNVAIVQAAQTDLNPADNTLQLTTDVVAPSLSILRNGNDVLLSWPASATGFVLQESDELTPATWSDVTTQPVIVGNQKRVTLRAIESCRCYRLRKL